MSPSAARTLHSPDSAEDTAMETLYTHQIPHVITDERVREAMARLDTDNALERLEIPLEEGRVTVLLRRENGRWVIDRDTAQLTAVLYDIMLFDENGETLMADEREVLIIERIEEALARIYLA